MKNLLKTKNAVCTRVFCFWVVMVGFGLKTVTSDAARKYTHTPIIWYENFELYPSTTAFTRYGDFLPPHIREAYYRNCPMGNNALRYDSGYRWWENGTPTADNTGDGNGMVREGITAAQCGLDITNTQMGHYAKVVLTNVGNTAQLLEVRAFPTVLPGSPVQPGMHSAHNSNAPIGGSRNYYSTLGCTVAAQILHSGNGYIGAGIQWPSGTNISTAAGGLPSSYPRVDIALQPNESAACLFYLNVDPGNSPGAVYGFSVLGGVIYEVTVQQNLGAIMGMIEYGLEAPADYLFRNPNHPGLLKKTESMGTHGRTF